MLALQQIFRESQRKRSRFLRVIARVVIENIALSLWPLPFPSLNRLTIFLLCMLLERLLHV